MIDLIYVEKAIKAHPRTRAILERFANKTVIECDRYTEIFNPAGQNFRLQKQRPALILARKQEGWVLPAPPEYRIAAGRNFYFSHMLNCLYDCRYCFLQGMYRSANYVLFVNYEDFVTAIEAVADSAATPAWFCSGYDCDSLALEPVTRFAEYFVPAFAELDNAFLELRTKSTQIRDILRYAPLSNVVTAFSFTPDRVARELEHRTPSVSKRLDAIAKLQQAGWAVGLRFDPLIYTAQFRAQYQQLFQQIFTRLNPQTLHSVSLGVFRLPKGYFRTLVKLYPEERLFAAPLEERDGMISYRADLEAEMRDYCEQELLKYLPRESFFPCYPESGGKAHAG